MNIYKLTVKEWFYLGVLLLLFTSGFYPLVGSTLFASDAVGKVGLLNSSLFIVSFSVFLITLICLTIYLAKKETYRPSWPIVIGLSVVLLINALTIVFFRDKTFSVDLVDGGITTFSFSIESLTKLRYIAQLICLLLLSFIIIDIIPKMFKVQILYVFSFACLLFVLVSIIGSYIVDNVRYIDFVKHLSSPSELYDYTTFSFYAYRNSYGFILFLGLVASLFLHLRRHKYYWFVVYGFIYLNLIFTLCKTALILGMFLLLLYLVIRFILSYKNNKKRNMIALIVITSICLISLISVIALINCNESIKNAFFDTGTISYRKVIWHNCISILNSTSYVLGAGFHLFGDILFIFNTSDPTTYHHNDTPFAHNGFLELMGNGGIVFLLAFALILIYVISRYIKKYKENKQLCLFEFSLIFVCLIYMQFESGTFILPYNIDSSYLSLIILMPAFTKNDWRFD